MAADGELEGHAPGTHRIVVHPATDLTYASPVVEALARVLGETAIRYSTNGFPHSYGGGRVMALYPEADPAARVFLGFADDAAVNPSGLAWSTAYAAVNVSGPELRPEPDDLRNSTVDAAGARTSGAPDAAVAGAHPTDDGHAPGPVLALGPTFGVRLSSNRLTARHLANTWRWASEGEDTSPRRRLRLRMAYERTRSLARHQRTRPRIDQYVTGRSDPSYVFYAASTYPQYPDVNGPRVEFVRACRSIPGLEFEGGFAPHPRHTVAGVEPLMERRYSSSEYMTNLRRSVVAFNNPAVKGCLGWKLGEQLALGKAIVTLPIAGMLPAPLEHGEHVHVIDGSVASMTEAIDLLRTDHEYRHHLETNARAWYEANLSPGRLAARVLTLLAR